jgi:hypothetical protein
MNPGRPASRPDPNAYLPWNHQEPLCGSPFPQVTPDRRGQSYRFSFGEVMRSLRRSASCHHAYPAQAAEAPNSDSRIATACSGIASWRSVNPFAPKPVGRCGQRIGVMSLSTNGRWSKPCGRRSVHASPRDCDAPHAAGQGRYRSTIASPTLRCSSAQRRGPCGRWLGSARPLPGTGCG